MCSFFLALLLASSTVASGSVITLRPRVNLTGIGPWSASQMLHLRVTTPPTTEWACRYDRTYEQEVCSQNFEMDLSTASKLKFSVEAPDADSMISITGPESTRIEFVAETDCPWRDQFQEIKFQEIRGSTFTPSATGGTGMTGLKYNASWSFVQLGFQYGPCEIITALSFDGPVNAQFHTLSWEVPVNASLAVSASTYTYGNDARIRAPFPYGMAPNGSNGIEIIKTSTDSPVSFGAKSVILKPWAALLTVASAIGAAL